MIWTAALLSTAALAAPSPAPYQAVLDQYLRQGRVDYAAIQRTGALDGTLDGLAKATEPTAPAASTDAHGSPGSPPNPT